MARTRYLKPGFFTNEELGELAPLARLLFAGLWCHADREGRLEDRPKRIKAEILPYEECTAAEVDQFLSDLDGKFLTRYEIDGRRYIAIHNWHEHQRPHVKEASSTIPAQPCIGESPAPNTTHTAPAPTKVRASTNLGSVEHQPRQASERLVMGNGEWGMGNGELGTLPSVEGTPDANAPDGLPAALPPADNSDTVDDQGHDQAIRDFDATLTALPERGYALTPDQLQKIGTRYGGIDLSLEAERIAEWLREPRHRQKRCSFRFLTNWLDKAEGDRQQREAERQQSLRVVASNGQVNGGARPYVPNPGPEHKEMTDDEYRRSVAARERAAEAVKRRLHALPPARASPTPAPQLALPA